MKKTLVLLALLLLPVVVVAQAPPGCSWEGDPILRYGWFYTLPEGNDTLQMYRGETYVEYDVLPMNAYDTYTPAQCHATDTFCFHYTDLFGWTIVSAEPMIWDDPTYLVLAPGTGYWATISINCPCSATVGQWNRIIISFNYTDVYGTCAPQCGDCNDPTLRGGTQHLWNADTLWVEVVESPPSALIVDQDTVTLVDEGQTQAYIPFTIESPNPCAPPATAGYRITSKGHVGAAIDQSGSIAVAGGTTEYVYGIINAGAAHDCDWDTLMIIMWNTADEPPIYDTCVQRIHVITPEPVPLFTVPVVTILVLALILAAAVFMRRRAVSKA